MPKIKSKSALQKRIKISASGKVKRGKANRSHMAHLQTTKQKRHAKKGGMMHESDQKRMKNLLRGA